MSQLSDILELNQLGNPIPTDLNFYMGMPCMIISMVNDANSTAATRKVITSITKTKSDLFPAIIPATTPDTLEYHLEKFGMSLNNWTYPTSPDQTIRDVNSGMTLSGYGANDIKKVMSCMVSHMRTWHLCFTFQSPVLVCEHDALFIKQFKFSDFPEVGGGIIGLNDPRGATRKSSVYYNNVTTSVGSDQRYPHIKPCPWVDDDEEFPQGLAGNSAYIIYPGAAKHMLNLVSEYGMWPNDALMCNQLVPFLSHTFPFYTKLQGVSSTTQG